jgi:L-Lysine epsilon oxidase N-terminal/L-lysine epsilon oxidase C-terminal domain
MAKPIIRIHPAIGVARVGNSQQAFIGPEIPGLHPRITQYRDEHYKLKRQAARFHLFCDDGGEPREITLSDVKSIIWTVHLRNTKAAAPRCSGVLKTRSTLRNARVKDRKQLVLDAKPQTICGANSEVEAVCNCFMARPFPKPLKLCTLRTDSKGRLLVLGGHGRAGSLTGASLKEDHGNDFANHDGWYDDTSDGSVEAVVTLKDNSKITARPSWVIVAPPKYAPALQSITTLYDTLYQRAIDDGREFDPFLRAGKLRFQPSFRKDIYPILRRASELRWVFSKMAVGHEHQFSVSQARKNPAYRSHVFRQFRKPSDSSKNPGSGIGSMPNIWSDLFPLPINGSVTRHQYNILQAWAEGRFDDDWETPQVVSKTCTPDGLDRAALEACVGAAFYPGIECSFHVRDKFRYKELFRLDHASLDPGDVTAQMSIPWQSDFVDCSDGDEPFVWWPAQRPINVVLPNQKENYPTVRWARSFSGNNRDLSAIGMVRQWHRLGLIGQDKGRFVETHRLEGILPSRKSKHRAFASKASN